MAKTTKTNRGTPTATAAAPSATPGTPDNKAGNVKRDKVVFPALLGPDGSDGNPTQVLLTNSKPENFDMKVHKPLKKMDFEKEGDFLRYRADGLEKQVEKLRAEADMSDKLGSKSERQKARRLLAMREKMSELEQQLKAAGIDIDEL